MDVGGKIVPGGAGSSCRPGRLFDGCDSLSEKEKKKIFGWFVRWHMVSDRFLKAFCNSREISCWHDNVFPVWVGLRSDTGTVF